MAEDQGESGDKLKIKLLAYLSTLKLFIHLIMIGHT